MGMIIGFGSTEKEFEDSVEKAIREYALGVFKGDEQFVSDATAKYVHQWVEHRAKQLRMEADEFKIASEYPDRYSYYFSYVLHDASRIVLVLKFTHINRRHAMSPDGWGAMWTERLVHIERPH